MQIRKAIFIVDKDRKYSFDVNQNITLKNLKKMIIAAANIGNIGLRIFQNGIEYTQNENETLDSLFPHLQTVEFTLSFAYDTIDDCNIQNSDNIKSEHREKYIKMLDEFINIYSGEKELTKFSAEDNDNFGLIVEVQSKDIHYTIYSNEIKVEKVNNNDEVILNMNINVEDFLDLD